MLLLIINTNPSHLSCSASELLSSSCSIPSHSPAPFATLHCRSASLSPAPAAAAAAVAAFKPADIAAAAGFKHCLFSEAMWNTMFQPWAASQDGGSSASPPQLFFDHDSTLDSCHLFYRFSPDWVIVLARVQHLRQHVILQARATLPDVCSLALNSIYEKAPDCFLVYSGKVLARASCVVRDGHAVFQETVIPQRRLPFRWRSMTSLRLPAQASTCWTKRARLACQSQTSEMAASMYYWKGQHSAGGFETAVLRCTPWHRLMPASRPSCDELEFCCPGAAVPCTRERCIAALVLGNESEVPRLCTRA
jgi:hypothetical protein